MERRTHEGHMDWEYENGGPLDLSSPFAQAAQNRPQGGSIFSTPSKPSFRPQPSAWALSSAQTSPPKTSVFQPDMRPQPIAPPFRNPMPNAFTTPRKPFDEVNFSEASGAEDSPAVTENSDYPNDTPEADRFAEMTMGGTSTITPSKINKATRYAKNGMMKKASGRGEIRPVTGKRRRHVGDRDVSFVNFDQSRFVEDSDMDSHDERAPRQGRSRSRGNKDKQTGILGSFFHLLDEHPNAPENLSKWMSFGFNFLLVFVCATMLWSTVHSVQSDLRNANEAARMELVSKMTECQNQYTLNECSRNDRPKLKVFCDEWYECMMQNPESIMRVKVTAKQVAEVFNEFTDTMSLRSWGIVIFGIVGCLFGSASLSRQAVPSKPEMVRQPSQSFAPDVMYVPVQTPMRSRHAMLDEGTDTDSSPPKMRPLLTQAPPSLSRRSPSKADRTLSPSKLRRSPTKVY